MQHISASRGRRLRTFVGCATVWFACAAQPVAAHEFAEQERQRMLDGGFSDSVRIGAEHMLTGYDHLLFLFGAVLFLVRPSKILAFVTAFTLGHMITLLGATFLGLRANPYLIDAAIALTVLYVAFQNMGLFRKWGLRVPNLIAMVFLFGLVHGLGLATRLQEMIIATDPEILSKIFAFNIGVELGQVIALIAMVIAVRTWRGTPVYSPAVSAANVLLVISAIALFTMQIHGFFTA